LYGNRNLDNFFCALDELKVERYEPASRIRVINLGDIYLDNLYNYYQRKDFHNLKPMERELALKYCKDMHGLLIIQHTDQRSQETIPYKVYDYLNLEMPILGIINNDELKEILVENGGITADNNSISSIKAGLKDLVGSIDSKTKVRSKNKSFDISEQFKLIFE
jgi:hypothetical protein